MTVKHSVGIILSIDDPSTFYQVKSYLEGVLGLKIIYITMTTDNRLYIIDEERMNQQIRRGQ